MNRAEIVLVKHALNNGNRFYTESDDLVWSGLVDKGHAVRRGGWEEGMSYFIVTDEGKEAFEQSQTPVK